MTEDPDTDTPPAPRREKTPRPETYEEALKAFQNARLEATGATKRLNDARTALARFQTQTEEEHPPPSSSRNGPSGRPGKFMDLRPLPWSHPQNLATAVAVAAVIFLIFSGAYYWLFG
ncbi:MAG: hypothetical protein EON60_12345 [Alphaproteobacteria bacterium]|nr:MAG: hypothetical protein EON60_12345 [Alphaproteobacteria bacterium]